MKASEPVSKNRSLLPEVGDSISTVRSSSRSENFLRSLDKAAGVFAASTLISRLYVLVDDSYERAIMESRHFIGNIVVGW